jgi:aryl-alcohol dehydrogenase-like predicted oxidoreductase
MDYVNLDSTGVKVSPLCFGTMSFGGDADEATSAKMFTRCREVGINFFDCANVYAKGRSEEILGRLMKGCRDELIITSKVGIPVGEDRNGRGLSRRHVFQQIELSLRRLDTDRLDVYFCHHHDPSVPVEETLAAFEALVRQGKVLYMGVSNWMASEIAHAMGLAQASDLPMIRVLQPMYNLTKRTAEIEILPLARRHELGVISYSPLAGGLLTGKYIDQSPANSRLIANKVYTKRYAEAVYHDTARRFVEYARKISVHPATLAVAWVMANPAITAPILGARNLEQLEPSLAAADYRMSKEQWREIAALAPPLPVATDRDEERSAQ